MQRFARSSSQPIAFATAGVCFIALAVKLLPIISTLRAFASAANTLAHASATITSIFFIIPPF